MKKLSLLIYAASFLPVPLMAQAIDNEPPLRVTLASDKTTYHLDEKIVFQVTVENRTSNPVKVLVRNFDWTDLAKMDENYQWVQEHASHDPQWAGQAAMPNLADKVRAESPPHPLGSFEFLQPPPEKNLQLGGIGTDDLFCGTGVKNGMMPAGVATKVAYTMDLHTIQTSSGNWGRPGKYRFVWRAMSPRRKKGSPPEKLDAASNILEVDVIP